MRLKSIKLAGFKSFAEPARLTFPSNITCIVGPNGCGKSNTLDAIRWVMGESSARNLRGGELNDVLFNGTDRRKPVSQCSVELIFDNSDHRLKGPWNRYAEISVRRVHHREQGTQYYLNGQRCRKRDVQALFDGTGLGPRSYALISQGNISQIIEARPEQLRLFLEEVAGIGFYRQRRREALSRLQATEENLAQLQVQHDAWQAQAETLRAQSESARRWRVLREEIAQLRRRWFQLEFRALKTRQQQLEEAFRQQQQVCARLQLDVEAAQKALLLAQKRVPTLEQQMAEARTRLHALDKELALAEAAREEQLSRRSRLQQQLTQLTQQRDQIRSALEELEMALAALPAESGTQAELDALEREAARLKAELQPLENQWQEVDRDLRALQYRRQECQSILNRLTREHDQLEARLEAAEAALEVHASEMETLQQQLEAGDPAGLEATARAAEAERDSVAADLQQQTADLHAEETAVEALRQELTRLEAEATRYRAELEGLQALQGEALPDADPPEGAQPLVSQLEVTDTSWLPAVEAWLDHWMRAWVVSAWPDTVPERGSMLVDENESLESAVPPQAGWRPLASLLTRAPAPVHAWAVHVFCTDADPTVEALQQLQAGQCVLTRDGRLWWRHGVEHRARPTGEGLLARQARIRSLEGRLAELDATMQTVRERLSSRQGDVEALRQRVAELRKASQAAEESARQARGQAQQAADRHRLLQSQWQRAQKRADQLNQELEKHRSRLKSLQKQVDEQAALRDELSKSGEALEQKHLALQQQRQKLQQALQDVAQRQTLLTQELSRRQQEHERLTAQLNRQQAMLEQLNGQHTQLDKELEALPAEADLTLKINSLKKELDQAREAFSAAEAAWQSAQAELERHRASLSELEKQQLRAEQKLERLGAQLEQTQAAQQRCHDEALAAGLTDVQLRQATLDEETSPDEVARALRQAEQTLEALGPVNMTAIEQLAELEGKLTELDGQMRDLQEAVDTLRQSIGKLDRDSRRRLREVFEAVNAGFQRMFPTIFRGGRAALAWLDEQADPLENGVLVMAQPPGKRNSRIQMLSGGEKTLTALALLFAIFELNPAPFCVLDEVDAPLDDANVARFGELVKSMAERVQFILITHNKTTMTMASELLGVTMQEPGVSRVVAVDLEAAVKMSEDTSA